MSRRRVVVTGLGLVAPVGLDVPTSWVRLTDGEDYVGLYRVKSAVHADQEAGARLTLLVEIEEHDQASFEGMSAQSRAASPPGCSVCASAAF